MKKSKLITLLALVLCFTCSLTVFACKKEPEQVFGFDVEETITVDTGTNVLVDVPIVTDKNGNPLDVIYEVTTINGGLVGVTANRFFAIDGDGYYINYAVMTADGVVHKKTTTVIVKGASNLYAEYEVMVDQGSTVEIKPITNMENPTYTYSVKYKNSGESVTVTNNTFVADALGFYTVSIQATDGIDTEEYSYEIYCRQAMQDGEIERFTSEWEEVRTLAGMDTFGWEVTTTEETGVPDRFGRQATYLKMVTSAEYGYFWINPRGNEDYYRQLASEGYTHVSFWVYCASNVNHDVMSQLYPDKGAYTDNIGKISPNVWTQIKVRLVETANDFSGSFASAVEYFKNQQTYILCFDNAAGWNSGGHEDNMTIYVGDVFAVKPADITTVENATLEYKTGDEISFSDIVNIPSNVEVSYTMTFRNETEVLTQPNYKFKANGVYTLNVIPTPNISTSLSITFTVTDDVTSSISDIQIERTGSSLTVNFADIDAELSIDGSPVMRKGYKVFRYGQAIQTDETSFTVSIDGAYTVELEGEYTVDNETYTTYYEIITDVWSNETKNIVSNGDLMLAHSEYCGWLNWDTHPSYVSGNYEVAGERGRMLKVTKLGQTYLVMMRPMYSKGYYQAMLEQNPTATVTLKYYVENEKKGNSIRSYFDGYESKGFTRNAWVIDTITLAKFVDDYDKLNAGYADVKYLMDYNITKTHSRSKNDYLFWFSGDTKKDIVYIPDILITTEAENGNVTTDGTLTVGSVNDISSMISVTLDGANATIGTIDVNYGGKWINLGDKTFTPEFAGDYDFRVYATTGNVYKTIEFGLSTGGTAITKTEDATLHVIGDGENFSLTPYTLSGYDVEYRVERIIGATLETVDCVITNDQITTANLGQYGSYKVTVTLIANSESVFGSFEYYTLILDYVSTTPTYITASEGNLNYSKAWNNWGSSSSAYGTATLAESTDANLSEKTGNYFKVEIKPRWAGDNDMIGVQVLPLNTKAYYESLLSDGQTYNLTFEWRLDCVYEYAKPITSFWYKSYGNSTWKQETAFDTWYTETINLQTLLDNWDNLTNNAKLSDTLRHSREIIIVRINGGSAHNTTVGNLYIGNFAIQKAGVTVEDVQLFDTAGKNELNLTELYTIGTISNATAVLTDSYGNETQVTDATAFSLTGVREGVYKVVLKENGNPVYTANVDIYDSSKGLVYNIIDDKILTDSQIWKHGYTNIGEATLVDNTLQFQNKLGEDGNTNNIGIRMKPLHSYDYYVLMSETFSEFTFDVAITGAESNVYVMGKSTYFAGNAKKTMSITLEYLLSKWADFNNLTTKLSDDTSMLFNVTSFVQVENTHTYTLSNFGYKAKEVESVTVADVKLVETSATPNLNLLSYDTESKLDTSKTYTATLTANNGRVVEVLDASNVNTADIPQGVYTATIKNNGITYLTVAVDIYTLADGMVWQEISEYSVNDARVWKFYYVDRGVLTYGEVNGTKVLQFTPYEVTGDNNSNFQGVEIRPIHSKEYYALMSESYEFITFDIHVVSGLNVKVSGMSATYGVWQAKNTTVTYQIAVETLLANWDKLQDVTTPEEANVFKLFDTYYSAYDTNVISIGNFGSVLKTAE